MSLSNQQRPKRFVDYVGQGANQGGPVDYIKTVISKNIHPPALILSGRPGEGKTSLSNLYTRATLCRNRKEGEYEACGECDVCTGENNDNINRYVVKDASEVKEAFQELIEISNSLPMSNTSRVDQFRRFIVIDEVQHCSKQAISMLLDPLEFSPPTTTWVLISMDLDRLDPIVREAIESRSKEIKLRSLSNDEIASNLSSKIPNLNKEASQCIAVFSNGNMRKAWSQLEYFLTMYKAEHLNESIILEQYAGGATRENRERMWECLMNRSVREVKNLVDKWCDKSTSEDICKILLNDLTNNIPNIESNLPIIAALNKWLMSKTKPPLSSLIICYDVNFKNAIVPEIENKILPIVKDISPNLESNIINQLSKLEKIKIEPKINYNAKSNVSTFKELKERYNK